MAVQSFTPECRDLLVIDQAPLFTHALDACQQACQRIEQLKADLHRFEALDLPAYQRWYHGSFGSFLTEIREITSEVREKEALLATLRKRHWENFFGSSCAIHAESSLGREDMRSRWASEEEAATEGFTEFEVNEDDGEEGEYGPDHEERRFEEGEFYFDDERDFDYDEDEESVRRFEKLFIKESAWRKNAHQRRTGAYDDAFRARSERHAAFGTADDEGMDAVSPARSLSEKEILQGRIKERYRMLVRKLHPDLNAELTPEKKGLWNQVQAAYKEKSLEKLDVLLALSDAFSGTVSRATSLHQLRRATREMERLIEPLRRKVEGARQSRAWRFSDLQDRSPLFRLIEKDFHRDVAHLRKALDQLISQIRRFTRPARPAQPESRI